MKESIGYLIGDKDYRKAMKNGAASIIGAAEKQKYTITNAEVGKCGDVWFLRYDRENK